MHTQQLTVNTQDRSHDIERSEEAAIWAEIATRLLEVKEATSAHRASTMISKLHALSVVHPEALWVVVSLLTGDLSQITKSYASIGKSSGRTKQAVQQELERVIAYLQMHFPNLAVAIIQLRHITAEVSENKEEQETIP